MTKFFTLEKHRGLYEWLIALEIHSGRRGSASGGIEHEHGPEDRYLHANLDWYIDVFGGSERKGVHSPVLGHDDGRLTPQEAPSEDAAESRGVVKYDMYWEGWLNQAGFHVAAR